MFEIFKKIDLVVWFQEKDWVLALVSFNNSDYAYDTFNVSMDLTANGMQNVDSIITSFFQYVKMMKQQGPLKRIYDELSVSF